MNFKLFLLSIFLIINVSSITADDGTEADTQNEETTISADIETTTLEATTESKELLETDLVVLENMAIQYLPQKLNFENVIEAYRLILDDGVRYEIIVNSTKVNQTTETQLCHLVVIEKPWLITVWNEKLRELKETNCSTIDEVQNIPQIILNKKYEMNTIFDIHTPDIKSDQLDQIESQILQSNKKPVGWKKDNKNLNVNENNTKTNENVIENIEKISSIPSEGNNEEQQKLAVEPIIVKEVKEEAIVKEKIEKKITNVNEKLENVETTTSGLSDDNKNYLDNFFKYFDFNSNDTTTNSNENNLNSNNKSNLNNNNNKEDENLQRTVDFQKEIKLDDQQSNRKKRSIYNESVESDDERHLRLFDKFQLKFNRKYESSLEKHIRYRIFKNNLIKIKELNQMEEGTAKYGMTEFADLTASEYKLRTGLVPPVDGDSNHIKNIIAEIPNIKLPKSFDWRKHGAVSEVKDQGSCGSCWAFSVTGNIEGLHAIRTGKLEEYSEQELLDCDTTDNACGGGYMDDAYKAIEKIGGLELESEYPYEARKEKCNFNENKVHVQVKGGIDLPKNETAMALWLVANGPISIGINANAMQFYRGGVSHPWKLLCRHNSLDHGVLIVGFGVAEYPLFNKTLPYWIVKNSWGPKWGEQGYYRVYRGDNTCGITGMATSAVLKD